MKFQSTNQLHLLHFHHIKQGRNCLYLCHDFRHCNYMMKLMIWLYPRNSHSFRKLMVFYNKGWIKFRSVEDEPDQVLSNPTTFVILDHAVLRKLNTVRRVEWKSYVNRNNERILGDVT